jgi:transcriptional regulator GlxA family with amidase domain
VKRVALDQGFGHLGRFSAHYRELFGESPSATIQVARRTHVRKSSPVRSRR